jgi:hypothetical protein
VGDTEDWAEIRRPRRVERMPIKVIARVLGCTTNTVTAAYSPAINELSVRGDDNRLGNNQYSVAKPPYGPIE